MLPLQITIEGFYSYQSSQTIDFSKLTEAKLFGIFGGVGSGKSSILEAMALVLYDNIERMGGKDKRNYNIMNLSAKRLYIDFIFESKKNIYRFTIEGKRHKTKHEEVKTFSRNAYQSKNGLWREGEKAEWEPIAESRNTSSKAEEILGLSYTNFKRTIIIPQGNFQEFLHLKDKDRSEMMKEIFNLHEFEYAGRVNQLDIQNNTQITYLKGQLSGLENVSPESVRLLKEEYQQLQRANDKQLKKLKKKQDLLQKISVLQKKHQEKQENEKQFGDLFKQKGHFDQRKEILERYELCQKHFKNMLDRIEELEKTIQNTENKLKSFKKEQTELEQKINANLETLAPIQKEFPKLQDLVEYVSDLKHTANYKHLQQVIQEHENSIKVIKETLSQNEKDLKKYQAGIMDLEKQIVQIKESQTDPSVLSDIQNWLNEKERLGQKISELKKQEQDFEQYKASLVDKRITLVRNNKLHDLFGENILSYQTSQFNTFLPQQKTKIREAQQKLQEEQSHFQTKQQLQQYVAALEEGKACPVCGSTHHPDKLNITDLTKHIEQIKKQQDSYNEQLKALETVSIGLQNMKEDFEEKNKAADRLKKDIQRLLEEEQKHQQTFKWNKKKFGTKESVQLAFKTFSDSRKQITDLEKEITTLRQKLNVLQESANEANKKISGQQGRIVANKKTQKDLLKQIKTIDIKDFATESLEVFAQRYEKHKSDLSLYQQLSDENTKLQYQLTNNVNIQKEIAESLKKEAAKLADENTKLADRIANSDFDNVGVVLKILDLNMNVTKEREAITAYDKQLAIVKDRLEKLKEETEGQVYDENKHKELSSEADELLARTKAQSEELGRLKSNLENEEKHWANKKVLQQELEKLESRSVDLKVLKSMFRSSGFVNYISTIYLKDLVLAANQRFQKLTRRQLSLDINEKNNIMVRDHLNEGKLRNARTLSGGQTFQASLCLALSLADRVQQASGNRENFFFLDEGFGSQDKASLQIVLETLKALRKENRIVGLISHVEELQQEMDVYLHIQNTMEGSVVRYSWE